MRSALTHVLADTYRTLAVLCTASVALSVKSVDSTKADASGRRCGNETSGLRGGSRRRRGARRGYSEGAAERTKIQGRREARFG